MMGQIGRHEKSRFARAACKSIQVYFTTGYAILATLAIIGCLLIGLCLRGRDTLQQIAYEQERVEAIQITLKGEID